MADHDVMLWATKEIQSNDETLPNTANRRGPRQLQTPTPHSVSLDAVGYSSVWTASDTECAVALSTVQCSNNQSVTII